ncbi:MAG: DHHA1 domain-containing protein [Bacillaceae bacterium]
MEKLYYKDQYIQRFTATIVNKIEKDGAYHIELDATAFYPEGGGQPSDIGEIEGLAVTDVYEEAGHIYHVMPKAPLKQKNVSCSINWERRFDHMQHHLGQHILSASFHELYQGNTVGFHLGKETCTVDIDRTLDEEQIRKAEKLANDIIMQNIPVDVLYPTKSELRKLKLKKEVKKQYEQIRIVRIADFDINPCGGTHPKATIEVQLLKVKKWEKHKNNATRITFICGTRAVKDSLKKDAFSRTICKQLTCNEEAALAKIASLTADYNTIISENRFLKSQIGDYEVKEMLQTCEKINGITIIKDIYEQKDMKEITMLANKLTATDNVIVLFGLKAEDRCNLLFVCSRNLKNQKMNELLQDAITLVDGRGGGTTFSAQGGGKSVSNLSSAIDYAYMKVQRQIN